MIPFRLLPDQDEHVFRIIFTHNRIFVAVSWGVGSGLENALSDHLCEILKLLIPLVTVGTSSYTGGRTAEALAEFVNQESGTMTSFAIRLQYLIFCRSLTLRYLWEAKGKACTSLMNVRVSGHAFCLTDDAEFRFYIPISEIYWLVTFAEASLAINLCLLSAIEYCDTWIHKNPQHCPPHSL